MKYYKTHNFSRASESWSRASESWISLARKSKCCALQFLEGMIIEPAGSWCSEQDQSQLSANGSQVASHVFFSTRSRSLHVAGLTVKLRTSYPSVNCPSQSSDVRVFYNYWRKVSAGNRSLHVARLTARLSQLHILLLIVLANTLILGYSMIIDVKCLQGADHFMLLVLLQCWGSFISFC